MSRSGLESFAQSAGRFLETAGEAAVHGAIQDPINALEQLADHIVVKPLTGHELPKLEIVGDLPKAKFGTPDWAAETLGYAAGATVDFLLLGAGLDAAGVTQAASNLAASEFAGEGVAKLAGAAASSAVTAGIYGAALVPSKEGSNFWKDRLVGGVGYAIGGAIGSTIGHEIGSYATAWLSDETQAVSLRTLTTTGVRAAARGSTGTVAKTGTFWLLGKETPTSETVSRRLVTSIARSAANGP